MTPVISVVVPIFNIEKYVSRCIDSILEQSFENYECILVDDGSQDRSSEICDEYAAKDERISVIHQKNAGTAAARNAGIAKACSEFIAFVDGDDWLEKDALKTLWERQKETDADIVLGGIRDIYDTYSTTYTFPPTEKSGSPLAFLFLTRARVFWGRLYRKTLFHDLYLPDTNNGEDAIVNVQIFSRLKPGKLQKTDYIGYNYDNCSGGISKRTKYNYTYYTESPHFSSRLWIESYLQKISAGEDAWSAFNLHMVKDVINLYLRHNSRISKQEARIFYEKYYCKTGCLSLIKSRERKIIPIFRRSLILGKIYAAGLNFLGTVSRLVKSFKRH